MGREKLQDEEDHGGDKPVSQRDARWRNGARVEQIRHPVIGFLPKREGERAAQNRDGQVLPPGVREQRIRVEPGEQHEQVHIAPTRLALRGSGRETRYHAKRHGNDRVDRQAEQGQHEFGRKVPRRGMRNGCGVSEKQDRIGQCDERIEHRFLAQHTDDRARERIEKPEFLAFGCQHGERGQRQRVGAYRECGGRGQRRVAGESCR